MEYDLGKMWRQAVDRSQGGLLEIEIWYFGTNELLKYITDSSSNLRRLCLAMCYPITNEGLIEAVLKLPLLEDLEVSFCLLSAESLKIVGQSCPNLKSLKLNCAVFRYRQIECDDDALAIAETMPGLCHLQLLGTSLSNTDLNVILDHCPNLEHLDLRRCFNVYLVGDLKKRCSERIKVVRRPNDSTHDYLFDTKISIMENEYPNDSDAIHSDYNDYDHYGRTDYNDYDLYGNHSNNSDYDHYDSDSRHARRFS